MVMAAVGIVGEVMGLDFAMLVTPVFSVLQGKVIRMEYVAGLKSTKMTVKCPPYM